MRTGERRRTTGNRRARQAAGRPLLVALLLSLTPLVTPLLELTVGASPVAATEQAVVEVGTERPVVARPAAPELPAAPAVIAPPIRQPEPPPTSPTDWQGTVARDANVRSAPSRSAPIVRDLRPGASVRVLRWVEGDEIEPDNPTWAEIAPGEFVFSMLLRAAPLSQPPAPPAGAPTEGKWIDVNLTLQIATAYEGSRPVRSVLVSTGRPGWETPTGTAAIQRRVARETMDGATLRGQGPGGASASYRVENVRWTQYFTQDGSAIHENSWRPAAAFGILGSHGCIGMPPDQAAWFWDWASVGTPLVVHP